jgi:hypothetical protein
MGLVLASVDPDSDRTQLEHMRGVFMEQNLADGHLEQDAKKLTDRNLAKLAGANRLLWIAACAFAILAVALLFIVRWLDRSARIDELLRPKRFYTSTLTRLFVIFAITILVAIIFSPVLVPQKIGFVGLLGLFLTFFSLAISQLYAWGRRLGVPLIAIVGLFAIVISAFDLNDNHKIRTVTHNGSFSRIELAKAFQDWWATREDRSKFAGRERYPVYIIAAQGGGIYAAHHVASFLAEIQDRCPNFAHHLFAISGVSGGSVGATAFAGLTRDLKLKEPIPDKWTCSPENDRRTRYFTEATEDIFTQDLLSPLAASLFFPDLVQRFIPVPIARLDRARAVEQAFEGAYLNALKSFDKDLAVPPQGLNRAFQSHWDPHLYPDTPALVLNTTDVASGTRRVISPFKFSGVGLSFLPVWTGQPSNYQTITLPLSTAALLSARFPWVTPAGWFEDFPESALPSHRHFALEFASDIIEKLIVACQAIALPCSAPALLTARPNSTDDPSPQKYRLVDGGFFENSGVATAADIINELVVSQKADMADIELVLIVFSSAGFTQTRSYGLAEILEPIRAMLNTRAARSRIEFDRAVNRFGSFSVSQNATVGRLGCRTPSTSEISISALLVKLELRGYGYDLPLGWRLSPVTRHLISSQNGGRVRCDEQDKRAVCDGGGVSAGCVKSLIYEKLDDMNR